jgi:sRNA-binding carbon storage regulator CsrA
VSLRLDRRIGQSITVPGNTPAEDVVITVHSIRDGRVRLQVEAHPEQAIYRSELWARLRQSRDAAKRT